MSDTEDKDLKHDIDLDEDFDYVKEIEAIEAQERELEIERQKKKAELEKLREERAQQQKKSDAQKKRERKERKKEAEWLGEAFEDDVETVPVSKKKKSKAGLIAVVVILLVVIAAGAAYAYKVQMDKKTVAEFESKVASFQTEKMDGLDLGSHAAYFDEFFEQCQQAIKDNDLDAIADLNKQWTEVETTLTTVTNGKTSLDAFVASAGTTLGVYYVTDDYKETYDTLIADIDQAKQDCDYEKVSELQKRVDALATNLKADNIKTVQTIKNSIASMDLDESYMSDDQKDKLAEYSDQVEADINDGNYSDAVSTLNTWQKNAQNISASITAKKEEEAAKAAAEAEARRKAESEAAAKAAAESESKAQTESKKESTGSSGSSSSSSGSDYILPDSSSRYLTASDVKNLSSYQLMIARNEIYARHGRKFNDKDLQAYFNGKSWYKGTVDPDKFSASVFNDYEIKNIELIQSYE